MIIKKGTNTQIAVLEDEEKLGTKYNKHKISWRRFATG